VRLAALAVAALLALAGCGGSDAPKASTTAAAKPPLRIGTKNFPEQFLLGEIYKQALEARGFPVELKANIGSSEIIHQALTDGALDMYPEYVGVLLSEVANVRARPKTPDAAYRRAQAFEAALGLAQLYGLHNAKARALAIGRQYAALDSGRVDVAAVFTTDGQLANGRYVILRDPRGVFGTQHVAPIISRTALSRYGPRLRAIIDSVSRRLTAPAMQRMNAQVQIDRRATADVAGEFLRGQGLK